MIVDPHDSSQKFFFLSFLFLIKHYGVTSSVTFYKYGNFPFLLPFEHTKWKRKKSMAIH